MLMSQQLINIEDNNSIYINDLTKSRQTMSRETLVQMFSILNLWNGKFLNHKTSLFSNVIVQLQIFNMKKA